MKMRPVMMVWTEDQTMVPEARFLGVCDKQFVVGVAYPMIPVEERSMKQHNRYFAVIHEMFENLPEKYKNQFKTEEGLRAKALVATGFCHEQDYVCESKSKAAFLGRVIRKYSEYAVIAISENVVKVFEPKSQSRAAMSAEEFKASQEAVLDWVQALNPGLKLADVKKEAAKKVPADRKESAQAAASVAPAGLMAPEGPVTLAAGGQRPSAPLNLDHPQSAADYFAYARKWILALTPIAGRYEEGREAAFQRWDAERELRDRLRVSIPNREQLNELIESQFKEVTK